MLGKVSRQVSYIVRILAWAVPVSSMQRPSWPHTGLRRYTTCKYVSRHKFGGTTRTHPTCKLIYIYGLYLTFATQTDFHLRTGYCVVCSAMGRLEIDGLSLNSPDATLKRGCPPKDNGRNLLVPHPRISNHDFRPVSFDANARLRVVSSHPTVAIGLCLLKLKGVAGRSHSRSTNVHEVALPRPLVIAQTTGGRGCLDGLRLRLRGQ